MSEITWTNCAEKMPPIPDSFVGKKQWTLESEGKNCPVYEELKECGERKAGQKL